MMADNEAPYRCRACGRSGVGPIGKQHCDDRCRSNAYRNRRYQAGLVRTRSGWKPREAALSR